jgi:hypothetical protein
MGMFHRQPYTITQLLQKLPHVLWGGFCQGAPIARGPEPLPRAGVGAPAGLPPPVLEGVDVAQPSVGRNHSQPYQKPAMGTDPGGCQLPGGRHDRALDPSASWGGAGPWAGSSVLQRAISRVQYHHIRTRTAARSPVKPQNAEAEARHKPTSGICLLSLFSIATQADRRNGSLCSINRW